jgi:hypothetical protein
MRGFFNIRRAKSFHCDICNEKFRDLESMEEHRRRMHHDAAPSVGSKQQ